MFYGGRVLLPFFNIFNYTKGGDNMNLKGSKTEANLKAAFAGESQARTKYEYYASKARKEGYNQIAAFLKKLHTMKRSMPRFGLNCCMMEYQQQMKT